MNILFFLKPKSEIAYVYDYFSIRQALEKMKSHGYTAIPIIDNEGGYIGSLSEGDLLWAVVDHNALENHEREHLPVGDIKRSREMVPVNVNAQIEDLLVAAMNQNFVPVIDDRGLFIGIVTRKDILQYYYDKTHIPDKHSVQ
ncbi:MAG: CBS domain-containing protein [Eubacteriales bacterium]